MNLEAVINEAHEQRAALSPTSAPPEVRAAVEQTIAQLDAGTLRVAGKARRRVGRASVGEESGAAVVPLERQRADAGRLRPVLRQGAEQVRHVGQAAFARSGVRVVPPAVARRGSFVAKNVVMMPSFVNIGAYVDEGTMVDTWVTVGSCAQIGKHVHLSGGVGIGGVLEPLQANPTIIEDNCFIGARSEIVEGVIVEENSVISMGVYISQSTKIYDRATGEVSYGRVPGGLGRRFGQSALGRWQIQPLLRGDRQEGRRRNARQDGDQRAAARLATRPSAHKFARFSSVWRYANRQCRALSLPLRLTQDAIGTDRCLWNACSI